MFDRSFNVEFGSCFVTIADKRLLNLPYGVLCDLSGFDVKRLLERGHPIAYVGRAFRIPERGIALDLAPAQVWDPTCRQEFRPAQTALIREHIHLVVDSVQRHPTSDGYSAHASTLRSPLRPRSTRWPALGILRPASGPLQCLREMTRRMDLKGIMNAAEQLVGLGPGLTPSGDDMLMGFFGSLLIAAPRPVRVIALKAAGQLAELSETQTTKISAVLFRALSQGYFLERFSLFIQSMLHSQPEPEHELEERLSRLFDFGSSSGREIAMGAALGLSILL